MFLGGTIINILNVNGLITYNFKVNEDTFLKDKCLYFGNSIIDKNGDVLHFQPKKMVIAEYHRNGKNVYNIFWYEDPVDHEKKLILFNLHRFCSQLDDKWCRPILETAHELIRYGIDPSGLPEFNRYFITQSIFTKKTFYQYFDKLHFLASEQKEMVSEIIEPKAKKLKCESVLYTVGQELVGDNTEVREIFFSVPVIVELEKDNKTILKQGKFKDLVSLFDCRKECLNPPVFKVDEEIKKKLETLDEKNQLFENQKKEFFYSVNPLLF